LTEDASEMPDEMLVKIRSGCDVMESTSRQVSQVQQSTTATMSKPLFTPRKKSKTRMIYTFFAGVILAKRVSF
jgi:hypothetical protein